MVLQLCMCVLISMLAGCGAGSTPRLMDLVGQEAFESQELSHKNGEWPRISTIGLIVHADASGRKAAPVIIAEYLETLTRRTEEFLRQRCSLQNIMTVPRLSQPVNFSQELKVQGQHLRLPYEMVVVFSSRENTGPVKIGEATMMNQMGGMVIENSAIAEVGILRLPDFQMVYWTQGRASESLEQLDVPIGKNRPSAMEARDILRARAGQQALDRALEHVGADCEPAV
ncbi:MAG: hypothetical protein NPIRA03_18420 [Nitrospirales bacterium]|nr:MAG: hypothetical protein NPIRA03_18420 [Nitrospirales bacterium]